MVLKPFNIYVTLNGSLMKVLLSNFYFALSLSILSFASFGQSTPYCPSINAQFGTGPSTTICQGNCATLTSSVVPVNQTTSYSVSSIPYAPFSFTSGTSIIANQDDVWSPVLNLGFPFCYYGSNYTQGVVGSNGQLTFSLGVAGGYDGWSISAALPSTANMPGNTICAAFRDIDPTSSGNIYYATYGTAPCRSFVISWNNIPMFSSSCASTSNSTFQLVLHETTNYIDVFINNSSACTAWNSGYGIVGIQNATASSGVAAPGRNFPTAWTAINEGWRFTPTGPQTYTVNWTGPSGPAGTGLSVSVCPTVNATYTANMSVSACGAAVSNYSSVVSVSVVPGPTLVTNSPTICGGGSATLTVSGATSYTWLPSNSNATSIVVSPSSTTTYTVLGSNGGSCTSSKTVQVTVSPTPTLTPGSNSPICAGSTLSLTVGSAASYTWTGPNSFSSNLQNPTIPSASTLAAGNYTVTATSVGGCTATAVVNVVVGPAPGVTANNLGPICAGQTLSLTSTGVGPWSWTGPNVFSSSNQNPTIPAATTAASGVYTVVAGVGTCTSLATTTVVVNATPLPVAANTGPYCPGATIQLSVGAFSTYTWSGPGSFSSNLQNPTQTNAQTTNGGVYTVTVTSASGCTNTANTNVVVNPSPVVIIGSNSPVCLGTAINLTSTGGGTYSWTGPNAFTSTSQNPTIPVSTLANAGNYSVTVTTAGCTSTAAVNVIVTTPTTSAANTGPYCAGTTINLSAPAATSYTWSGPGGFSSNVQNPTQPGSTTAMAGTYTVIVSIGTCTATATTNVIVNPSPTSVPNSNSPVCAGQTINFTGLGGVTYTWTGPAFTSTLQNPTITNASSANSGTYSLTVTDASGCSNMATTNVVVNALPTIVVSNPTTCVNTTINLTSNGGVTYSWTGPNTFTSNVQNPNIPSAQLNMSGTYIVTVTDANGCVNTANANVSVLPAPTPNIASNSPVCAGGTLNLFGSGGAVYGWSGPGYTGASQNPVINNVTASASGVYTLLVSSGTCTASTTHTVIINPLPVFNFSGSNALCFGQSNGTSTVNVTVGTGPFNYNWSTIPAQTTQDASGLAAGTYSCTVTDANGCSSISSTQITQPTLFTVSINAGVTSACAGVPINITAIGNGGTGPYNYNWVSGPSTSVNSVNETLAGSYNYVVNAVDAFNCPASANINLTFFPQPTVTATSATICGGQGNAVLTASGANTYTWQPGNITGSTYSFSGNQSIVVTVVGTANGCNNSATTAVIVNPIPTANISTSNAKGCVPTCVTFSANGASNITSYGWILNGA
jgi:hypothetical protein